MNTPNKISPNWCNRSSYSPRKKLSNKKVTTSNKFNFEMMSNSQILRLLLGISLVLVYLNLNFVQSINIDHQHQSAVDEDTRRATTSNQPYEGDQHPLNMIMSNNNNNNNFPTPQYMTMISYPDNKKSFKSDHHNAASTTTTTSQQDINIRPISSSTSSSASISSTNNYKPLNKANHSLPSLSHADISSSTTPILSHHLSKHKNLAPIIPKQQSIKNPKQHLHHQQHQQHQQQYSRNSQSNQPHNNYHPIKQPQSSSSTQTPSISLNTKICIGTTNKLTNQHNRTDHYQNLVDRYKDCTYVIGNLEITWVEKDRDLSFLESIREISGYLLIADVEVELIRLPNLHIIRGRDQYNHEGREYALFLINNELKSLELPNLTEILVGSYGSYHNKNLCYINTINWDEILNVNYSVYNVYDGNQPSCPQCDRRCGSTCWAEGPEMCQRFTKVSCSCAHGRCYGPSPNDCCHSYCAGGCSGPKETDCLACKNFYDDGACVSECPSMMRYNSEAFLWEPNPKGKYAFGAFCVKDCPEHLLRDNGACVRTCPANKRSVNGECVSCGGPCPKNCQGVEVIHSGNIDQLINCTIIEGSITISDSSFYGSQDHLHQSNVSTTTTSTSIPKYKPMHPNRLEALKNLREITGYLNIHHASHPDFKNLSFFRNLMLIGGREATDYSLSIVRTSLVSLNLHSLRKVKSGKILIEDNKDLCFAETIDWAQTNITRKDEIITRNNAEPSKCRSMGLQCHEQCARDGCWGSGPDECLSCNNYKLDDYCVDNCSSSMSQIGLLSYVDGPRICKKCHWECARGCNGAEARNCFACKNVKDGPFCVAECPRHKYNSNGICQACDKSCLDGCTGPSNKLGEGGCNSCAKVILNSTDGYVTAHCMVADEPCPVGYYQEYVGPQAELLLKPTIGKPVCRKCHSKCKSCTGMGTHTSVCECAKYVAGEQCEESCPRDYYEDEQSRHCLRCSPECNGCYGPTEADCHTCRVYRIYHSPHSQLQDSPQNIYSNELAGSGEPSIAKTPRFNCTAQCPPDKPRRISDLTMLAPYCSEDDGVDSEATKKNSLSTVYLIMLILLSGAFLGCFTIRRFQRQTDKTVKLTMHLSGIDDVEPLHPSNLKPNLAPLRSIKETELRRGKKLGAGFGGTVYQGLWFPEGQEHKKSYVVAIKVLRENEESNMNKEFLDEAYIMASVNHPNLVRLLAVCMTPSHLMLVTQLMPLGCLLDYVRKYRDDIGSKNLFEWCKQIARGMAYLEEHRMVHRDLALRNVLLQKSGRALVSDFGLAKFLDVDQNEYHSGNQRLPIKWLAPECIKDRKFTHKSDVWAFGVTVWELLTFGMKPFEEYQPSEVFGALVKGARLCQPNWMSTEVYKVMYACWFYIPDQRPDFKGLVQNFVNFARDPERYMICRTKGIDYSLNIDSNGKNSDCDDMTNEEYNSDMNEFTEDESQPPSAVMPVLTPMTHNRLNEMNVFEFENRNKNDNIDSETETQHTMSPLCKSRTALFPGSPRRLCGGGGGAGDDDVFITSKLHNNHHSHHQHQHHHHHIHGIGMDVNNNCITQNGDGSNGWPMMASMSTNSLGHKSDQPTDGYDYLLPSPSTNEPSHYDSFVYGSTYDAHSKTMTITPSSLKQPSNITSHSSNPPHSAGPIGVNNEEYFLNGRVNYVNYKNTNVATTSTSSNSHLTALHVDRLTASNNNIPHSLV